MRTLPIHIDRLEAALAAKGVRLKRHSLLEVAAAAFGYVNQNQLTAAGKSGDLDVPPANPIGLVDVAGHRVALMTDESGRPFCVEAKRLDGEERTDAFIPTPYGGLVDVRALSDLHEIASPSSRSEELHAASISHDHGDNLYLDRTEAGLDAQIADFCRDYWKEVAGRMGMPESPDGLSDKDVREMYFSEHESETLVIYDVERHPIGPVDFGMDCPFVPEGFRMDRPYMIARMIPTSDEHPVLYWSNADGWGDARDATVFAEPVATWPGLDLVPGSMFVVPLPKIPGEKVRDIAFLTNRDGTGDTSNPMLTPDLLALVSDEEIEVGMGEARQAEIGYIALVDGELYVAPTIKAFHFGSDDQVRALIQNRDELVEYRDRIQDVVERVGGFIELEEDTEAVTLTMYVPITEAKSAADFEAWKEALQDLLTPNGSGPRIMAEFSPQQSLGDSCIDVDPHGETAFDVTYEIKLMGEEAAHLVEDEEMNHLSEAVRAPSWIRNWSGPSGVAVRQAVADHYGFDVDDRS